MELNRARKCKLEIKHRSDILAWLIDQNNSIVVSGSHGKKTTRTYITRILSLANKKPTAVIGGIVPLYNKNYHFLFPVIQNYLREASIRKTI